MSNRKAARSGNPRVVWWRNPGRITVVLLCVAASAISLARLSAKRTAVPFGPPPPAPTLSKEYVYAGGRLVAIEETEGAGAVPTGLLATARSDGQVSLAWAAPASGSVDHYEVERTENLAGSSPYPFTCPASPCPDTSAAAGRAYLYRVRAVFAGGARSAYSNRDVAATAVFADDPLNANGTRTTVRALHFTQLRDAVNAVRAAAGLPPFDWTDPAPQPGGAVRASHYNDLRAALGEALARFGLPGPQSAPAGQGVTVTYQPVQELRDLMR